MTNSLIYTPDENWSGNDSFTYNVTDNQGGTAIGKILITVNAVNDAPVLVDDGIVQSETDEDTSTSISLATLLAEFADVEGDSLSYAGIDTGPSNGSVTLDTANNSLVYTPAPDWNGEDSFTYNVTDNQGGTSTGTVQIQIAGLPDAPEAVDDGTVQSTIDEDTSANLSLGTLLAEFEDADGDILVYAGIETGPLNGSVTLDAASNLLVYTPDAGWSGQLHL